MSRIINTESAGKERNFLIRTIVLAIRELARQTGPSGEAPDLVAYIALSLRRVAETIDVSVNAWEKRGYWVKADRFRMDWMWTRAMADKLITALQREDWGAIARLSAQATQKFNKVKVSSHNRMGKPWVGAWKALKPRGETRN